MHVLNVAQFEQMAAVCCTHILQDLIEVQLGAVGVLCNPAETKWLCMASKQSNTAVQRLSEIHKHTGSPVWAKQTLPLGEGDALLRADGARSLQHLTFKA
jgi:hypothetical protein